MTTGTPVHIVWTGGWYQTYRVLRLAMIARGPVVPHFVIDPSRRTSLLELESIWRVRALLAERDPEAANLIEPLRLTSRYEVRDHTAISDQYRRLRASVPLEAEYDWLARYADEQGLTGLEVSLRAVYPAETLLRDRVIHTDPDGNGGYWQLDDRHAGGDLSLFSRFRFPILYASEAEMRDQAEQLGFLDILDLTWFCFKTNRGEPCGTCDACRYALQEGMRQRFSRVAMLRHRLDDAAGRAGSVLRRIGSVPGRIARKLLRR